jgi:hypothetical protein
MLDNTHTHIYVYICLTGVETCKRVSHERTFHFAVGMFCETLMTSVYVSVTYVCMYVCMYYQLRVLYSGALCAGCRLGAGNRFKGRFTLYDTTRHEKIFLYGFHMLVTDR